MLSELSDDEMEVGPSVTKAKDDTAWTPKVKVMRGTLNNKMERADRNSKKVAAVEAGLKQAAEKRRKTSTKKKQVQAPRAAVVVAPPPQQEVVQPVQPPMATSPVVMFESKSSLLMPASTSTSTLEAVKQSLSRSESMMSKKPKKGSTAKQRLGKILKLKF